MQGQIFYVCNLGKYYVCGQAHIYKLGDLLWYIFSVKLDALFDNQLSGSFIFRGLYWMTKMTKDIHLAIVIPLVHSQIHPSLDLTNNPVRPLLFTKSCNSLNQIEFAIVKYFKGVSIWFTKSWYFIKSRFVKSRLECVRTYYL